MYTMQNKQHNMESHNEDEYIIYSQYRRKWAVLYKWFECQICIRIHTINPQIEMQICLLHDAL